MCHTLAIFAADLNYETASLAFIKPKCLVYLEVSSPCIWYSQVSTCLHGKTPWYNNDNAEAVKATDEGHQDLLNWLCRHCLENQKYYVKKNLLERLYTIIQEFCTVDGRMDCKKMMTFHKLGKLWKTNFGFCLCITFFD